LGVVDITFIVLIPKKEKPETFMDYKAISLCNLVYKLISKLISCRIKSILLRNISNEQFVFLEGRKIQDVVGIAQGMLHSVKSQKLRSFLLKIDLIKAYDYIDWEFLKLVLIKSGMSQMIILWIMVCIQTTNFALIINDFSS